MLFTTSGSCSAFEVAIWVELLKGTGFPMEANVGRGLRWRTQWEGETCDLSQLKLIELSQLALRRTWIEDNEDHAKAPLLLIFSKQKTEATVSMSVF